jgi:hypothetical protein
VVKVTVYGIEAEVHPSGSCAMLIPHADSEQDLSLQQSLNRMPRHQLILFAAVQAVEWGIDAGSGDDGTRQAIAWKKVFMAVNTRWKRKWDSR